MLNTVNHEADRPQLTLPCPGVLTPTGMWQSDQTVFKCNVCGRYQGFRNIRGGNPSCYSPEGARLLLEK